MEAATISSKHEGTIPRQSNENPTMDVHHYVADISSSSSTQPQARCRSSIAASNCSIMGIFFRRGFNAPNTSHALSLQ
jgi:hypothetical protein